MIHIPVMVPQVLHYLLHEDARLILDGTVGCGGHARAILEANSSVMVVGVDRDADALKEARSVLQAFGDRVHLRQANYFDLPGILSDFGKVDGVLLDLGLSSLQLDRPNRGFSYNQRGPLDMRMSDQGQTAKSFIDGASIDQLVEVLKKYGEVSNTRRIARSIRAAADDGRMNTTQDLRGSVESAVGRGATPSLLSKVFQAIRITVNDEIQNLETFLHNLLSNLNKNATAVVLSYHSLEDRLIKNYFKRESTDCICPPNVPVCVCGHRASFELLTRRVVRPTSKEAAENRRARSARLRAVRVSS